MIWRVLSLLCSLFVLSACTSAPDQPSLLSELRGTLSGVLPGGNTGAPSVDLRRTITRDAIANTQTPLLFVDVPSLNAQAALIPTGQNGRVRTWSTADSVALSIDRGVVTATRGFAVDLISSNLRESHQGITGARVQGARIHRYIDANEQLVINSFICNYARTPGQRAQTLAGSFTATLTEEDCVDSQGRAFVNRYWSDSAGLVRKSEQWIGPEVGMVRIELLKNR